MRRGEFVTDWSRVEPWEAAALAIAAAFELENELEALLLGLLRKSSFMGLGHVEGEIEAWYRYFSISWEPLNLAVLARLDETTLIQRIPRSFATYGAAVESSIRDTFSGAVAGLDQREKIVDEVRTVIQRERWKADRIVRTELSDAYNGTHLQGLRVARDEYGLKPKKSAIATFDGRTARDSYPVHGQVRELEENFTDGAGRSYLHPPGRPNDREKEIPWFDTSDDLKVTREEGIERAERLRKAQESDQRRRRERRAGRL